MSLYAQFAACYEKIFPFRPEAYRLLARGVPPGGRVLDLGCGPGHHCGHFADAGFQAWGVDMDPTMIENAHRLYPGAHLRVGDLGAAELPEGPFDLIYAIGNVIAHLDAPGLDRLVSRVAGLLTPGGRWVVQTVNWDRVLKAGHHRFPLLEYTDEGISFEREYLDIGPDRVTFVATLQINGATRFREETTLHPHPLARLEEVHRQAGLTEIGRHADFKESPFTVESSPGCVLTHVEGVPGGGVDT